ncbi:MAG: isoprenylcysteine carboxylmethyltransferase family protein [Saprospiraceae bacterium]
MPLQEELESQGNFLFRYRGSIPILVLVAAILVFASQSQIIEIERWYFFLCFGISMIGLLIRIGTVGFTPKNTSGRNTKEQIADEINTTGIYSTVRHPLYVGNFVMWLGAALLTHHLWFILFFTAFYWIYYERIMFAEEQFLRKKFGMPYLDWASRTPAFVPSLQSYIPPKYPFSLKKVVRREVNGLLNIFLVFTIFDLVYHYIKTSSFGVHHYVWIGGVTFSLLAYLVLKLISKNTSALDEKGRI